MWVLALYLITASADVFPNTKLQKIFRMTASLMDKIG